MTNPTDALTAVPDAEWQQKYDTLLDALLNLRYREGEAVGGKCYTSMHTTAVDNARAALDAHVLTRQPAVAPKAPEVWTCCLCGKTKPSVAFGVSHTKYHDVDCAECLSNRIAKLLRHDQGEWRRSQILNDPNATPAAVAPKAHESLVAELEREAVTFEACEVGDLLTRAAAALRTPATCSNSAENYTRSGDMLSEHTRSAPAQSLEVEPSMRGWTKEEAAIVGRNVAQLSRPLSVLPAESATGAAREESGNVSDVLREALELLREPCTPSDRAAARVLLLRALGGLAALRSDTAQPDEHDAGDCTGEGCDGGEVFVGSNGHPDGPDMGWTTCLVCGGTGKQPTNADIVKLREAIDGLAADLMVERWEREHTEAAQPDEQERALREYGSLRPDAMQAFLLADALDEIFQRIQLVTIHDAAESLRTLAAVYCNQLARDARSQPKSVAADERKPEHVCGMHGFAEAAMEHGDTCPACEYNKVHAKVYRVQSTDPTTDEGA